MDKLVTGHSVPPKFRKKRSRSGLSFTEISIWILTSQLKNGRVGLEIFSRACFPEFSAISFSNPRLLAVFVQLTDSLSDFRVDHSYMAIESDFDYLKGENLISNGDFEFDLDSPFSTWTGFLTREVNSNPPSGLVHAKSTKRQHNWEGVNQMLSKRIQMIIF